MRPTPPYNPTRRRSEGGATLIEVLIGFSLIMITLGFGANLFLTSIGAQQDVERNSRAIQVARDYIEKSQSVEWRNLAFRESDNGYRAKFKNLDTSTVEQEDRGAGIQPVEERYIGGVEYTVRTDILKTSNHSTYAARLIRVEVQYVDSKERSQTVVLESLRSPIPSEQIPPAADLTDIPANNGAPAAPTFYDEITQIGGSYSTVLGTELTVKVPNPGQYPVNNIVYNLTCPDGRTAAFTYTNTPSGVMKSASNNTWMIRYSTLPASFPCAFTTVGATVEVRAQNNAGLSAPLTITAPTNYDIQGE